MVNILHHLFIAPVQTSRATERGGKGGYNDPGDHGLLGGPWASGRPMALAAPAEDHLISSEKNVRLLVKTFFSFFGDYIIFRTKLRHFLCVSRSSQNRKSVIFELAPGPCSALGPPANQFALVTLVAYIEKSKERSLFLWQMISCSLIGLLIIAVHISKDFPIAASLVH